MILFFIRRRFENIDFTRAYYKPVCTINISIASLIKCAREKKLIILARNVSFREVGIFRLNKWN